MLYDPAVYELLDQDVQHASLFFDAVVVQAHQCQEGTSFKKASSWLTRKRKKGPQRQAN